MMDHARIRGGGIALGGRDGRAEVFPAHSSLRIVWCVYEYVGSRARPHTHMAVGVATAAAKVLHDDRESTSRLYII